MSAQDTKMSKWKEAGALEVDPRLDGHIFALEAAYVREILDLGPVTEVPSASPFVNGLINVRSKSCRARRPCGANSAWSPKPPPSIRAWW